MGKSQARRLREATKRFGHEHWGRWYNARVLLAYLIYQRKKDAGLIAHTVIGPVSTGPVSTGPTSIMRYSTSLTWWENEDKFGRPR